MSDEKSKPFAVTRDNDQSTFASDYESWVELDGVRAPPWTGKGLAIDTDVLNAAVEAREAKLRGALRRVVDAVRVFAPEAMTVLQGTDDTVAAFAEAKAVLAGAGPDYVPATHLAAANKTIAKMKAAFAVLDPGESMTRELVCQYLEANGLRGPDRALSVEHGGEGWHARPSPTGALSGSSRHDWSTAQPALRQFSARRR